MATVLGKRATGILDETSDEERRWLEALLRKRRAASQPDPAAALRRRFRDPYDPAKTTCLADESQFRDLEKQLAVFSGGAPSHVKMCTEQGKKSACIASLCVVNRFAPRPRPIVVACGCNVSSVDEVASKIGSLLAVYDELSVSYLARNEDVPRFFAEPHQLARFLEGRTVVFVKAQHDRLAALLEALSARGVRDGVLVIDEFDSVVNASPADPQCSKRALRVHDLLTGSDGSLFGPGAPIGTLVPVSATHVATLLWHVRHGVPFVADVVDLADSMASGYATCSDLHPARDADGRELFFQRTAVDADGRVRVRKLTSREKMDSAEFRSVLTGFRDDPRDFGMLQIALTSFTSASRKGVVNMRDVARRVLGFWPAQDAVAVLVVTGHGVLSVGFGPETDAEGYVTADGVRASLPQAIRRVEEASGGDPALKLVVVGLACTLRSTSPRGSLYVITHLVCVPSDGMSAANLEQLVMRMGGKTRDIRASRGYDGVTTLMSREDHQLVRGLYDLTAALLRACGTGRREDLDSWRGLDLDARFGPVVGTFRKHAERSLHPERVVGRLHVLPAPDAADFPPYRGFHWQRLLVEYHAMNATDWFVAEDYTDGARAFRADRSRMGHGDLYRKGYLVREAGARRGRFRYRLTDKGRRAAEAYRQGAPPPATPVTAGLAAGPAAGAAAGPAAGATDADMDAGMDAGMDADMDAGMDSDTDACGDLVEVCAELGLSGSDDASFASTSMRQ